MIVELEISDLNIAATALNNARVVYQRVVNCIKFGFEVDSIFLKLEQVPEKYLDDQVKILKDLTDKVDEMIKFNLEAPNPEEST